MRIVLIYSYVKYNFYIMKKNPRNILSEKNVSITNPRILVIEELLNHKKRPFLSKEEFDKFMSNKTLKSVAVYYTK